MFEAVVIGVSAGGMNAMKTILSMLPATFHLPIVIVQHIAPQSDSYFSEYLERFSNIKVKEAEEKEKLRAGTAYIAPSDYHLLIEPDQSFSLSADDKVNYSRPSIDLLFESAADVFGNKLVGIVLTGANSDGSYGLKTIKDRGGLAIVQDPKTAESPFMPQAAINATSVDYIVNLGGIAPLLLKLCKGENYGTGTHG